MRIATFVFIIIFAVVSLAAPAVGWQRGIRSISNNSDNSEGSSESSGDSQSGEVKRHSAGQWLSAESALKVISEEASQPNATAACCPSVLEMIEPAAGVNFDNDIVALYRSGEIQQRFYEVSCQPGVEGRPCRFLPHKLHNQSMCVQKYSYTYALVTETPRRHQRHNNQQPGPIASMGNLIMDYIKVRSGCSCELKPKNQNFEKTQKRNSKERKGKKSRSRNKSLSRNLP